MNTYKHIDYAFRKHIKLYPYVFMDDNFYSHYQYRNKNASINKLKSLVINVFGSRTFLIFSGESDYPQPSIRIDSIIRNKIQQELNERS